MSLCHVISTHINDVHRQFHWMEHCSVSQEQSQGVQGMCIYVRLRMCL